MTYASLQNLTERFEQLELVQITNPHDHTAQTVNQVKVDDALADADAVIDAKIGARYALPLATVPRVLRNIACDLARARLYEDRITDHVLKREEAAMKLLDEIRDGKVTLGLDLVGQPAAAAQGGPQFTEPNRVFTRDSMSDYAP